MWFSDRDSELSARRRNRDDDESRLWDDGEDGTEVDFDLEDDDSGEWGFDDTELAAAGDGDGDGEDLSWDVDEEEGRDDW